MQHHHVADAHDQVARRSFRQLRRKFLLLLLEFRELDLHQFILRQRDVHGTDETLAQTRFADFKHGFQMLRGRLEFADLGIVQWFEHGTRSLNYSSQNAMFNFPS